MRIRFPLALVLALFLAAHAGAASRQDLASRVGFDQHLGERLPLDAVLRDEGGRPVRLSALFGERPVVLALVYFECPNLCTFVLNGLLESLTRQQFTAGREFDVVAVSIDPRETPMLARQKKEAYVARYGRPAAAAGWHFLTGDAAAIGRLAQAVGFRYFYDQQQKQYAHPAGITVTTPDGRIARYLFGIVYPERDLRLALVEASANRIGTPVDRLLLLCFHYDPATGRYGPVITASLRALAAATVVGLGGLILVLLLRERRQRRRAGAAP